MNPQFVQNRGQYGRPIEQFAQNQPAPFNQQKNTERQVRRNPFAHNLIPSSQGNDKLQKNIQDSHDPIAIRKQLNQGNQNNLTSPRSLQNIRTISGRNNQNNQNNLNDINIRNNQNNQNNLNNQNNQNNHNIIRLANNSQPQTDISRNRQSQQGRAINNREQHLVNQQFAPYQQPHQINATFRYDKMDAIYAQSFKSLKFWHQLQMFIVFSLMAAVAIFYKLKYSHSKSENIKAILQDGQMKLSIIPFLIIFQFGIFMAKLIIYCSTYRQLSFALDTAQTSNHAVHGQPANRNGEFQQNISQRILLSQTQVTHQQGLDPNMYSLYKDQTSSKIKTSVKRYAYCSYQIYELLQFGMFVCSFYLIVVLAHDPTSVTQKAILITTVLYWFVQNYKLILCIVLLLFSPFIVLGVIVFVCVSGRVQTRQVKLPQPINPNNQQILNTGGTCAICMMDFDTANSVIILPCSNKHMFHQLCLKGWINIKTTCPICRHDLAQLRYREQKYGHGRHLPRLSVYNQFKQLVANYAYFIFS